ncbi:hypothetical protein Tco_1398613, partial [Tanacetum coccineum]
GSSCASCVRRIEMQGIAKVAIGRIRCGVCRQSGEERGTVLEVSLARSRDRELKKMYSWRTVLMRSFPTSRLRIYIWVNGESEQDPLDKLNDLAKKKIKNADDIHDYFRANKRLKSSVHYEDHLAGIVLNEPVLGMILFNSFHRKDFVTIKDFRDFQSEMLYTVQEIFFRLHQAHGLDDLARTFSSFLLAEVDKRNLNPLKQIKVIEQLRL